MEYTMYLDMKQLLGIIKTLPRDEKAFLKTYIEKEISEDVQVPLTSLLLSGPTMSEEQIQSYQHLRKEFKTWTKNLF